jgi:ATP-dependent 26S proteasome regulatory subunit
MPNSLDKALTRPGRFDKKITLPYPSQKERENLFHYYLNKLSNVSPSLNIESLATMMTRKTGADVKNLVNQAALVCIGRDGEQVETKGKCY